MRKCEFGAGRRGRYEAGMQLLKQDYLEVGGRNLSRKPGARNIWKRKIGTEKVGAGKIRKPERREMESTDAVTFSAYAKS